MTDAPLLHLHGLPRVDRSDGTTAALSAREAALLAWLHLEGPTPRGALAGRLWPGGTEAQARANLRQTLMRLRRTAGPLLVDRDGTLQMAPDVTVAAEDPTTPARLLGPLEFDDAPELAEWLQARREAAQRDALRRRLADARAALEQGLLDEALALADAVLSTDAAVEEAHRLRMQVFHLRGDRAAAVAAWDECRQALRSAFGLAPSAATNALGQTVMATEAASHPGPFPGRPALPLALRRPPRFVGRTAERDALVAALAQGPDAVAAAVVAAPGGAGKSRLMDEVAALLGPAVRVGGRPGDEVLPGALASRLVASAVEQFTPVLDSTTREDIARLLPGGQPADDPRPLTSALEHRRVLASVARTMLACHARGMRLVVVDDLQFADALSLEAIGVVMGGWLSAPPREAAVALFGCRPDELSPAGQALVRQLDGSRRCLRVDLGPLDVEGIAALLDSLPLQEAGAADLDRGALAAALHAKVGGHPAYVLESVRHLWPSGLAAWRPGQPLEVPPTLVESVRLRVERLSPEALQLAQLAGVAQSDFSLALAADAFGRPPLALSPLFAELEAAQVLDGTGFSHDLVGQAVQQTLPASLRAPLHRLVAEHLQDRQGPAASVAAHLQAAGERRAAAQWHLRAGRRALARWQLAEAATALEAALDGLDPGPERATAVLAGRDAARAWLWQSRHADAARVLARVAPLVRSAAERVQWGAVQLVWLLNTRQLAAAGELARTLSEDLLSVADLPVTPDADDLLKGLRGVTVALPLVGEGDRALSVLQRLQPHLDLAPPANAMEFDLIHGALLCRLDRAHAAQAPLEAALKAGRTLGHWATVVSAGGELTRAMAALGRTVAALEVAQATLGVVVDQQFGAGFEADLRSHLALMAAAAGRPALAARQLEEAAEVLTRAGRAEPPVLASARALTLAELGRLDDARRCLDAQPPIEAGDTIAAHYRARVQARLRLMAQAASPGGPREPAPGPATAATLAEALMHAQAGPPPSVEQARDWLARAEAQQLRPQVRQALQQQARAAHAAGDRETAVRCAQQAWAMPEAIDGWFDTTASRWLDAAAVLDACGADDAARAARAAGRAWVLQAAGTLPPGPARDAWTEGHPLHAQLLAGPG